MEDVYEQFFFLKNEGNWSFTEAYNLPVGLRIWFVERLIKHMEMKNEANQNASGGKTQTLSSTNQPPMPLGIDVK
tara:strand:+ start:307 stop:531 length:225 start_codon:yes stop_codon:yes gene_type:complete